LKRELDTLITQMHSAGIPYADAIRQFKKRYILEVLAHHKGNQCKARDRVGMHRNTLSRTLAELDLDSAQIRKGMRRPVMSERPAMAQRMAMGQRPRNDDSGDRAAGLTTETREQMSLRRAGRGASLRSAPPDGGVARLR